VNPGPSAPQVRHGPLGDSKRVTRTSALSVSTTTDFSQIHKVSSQSSVLYRISLGGGLTHP
jgi:hypothetical protein